MLGIGAVSRPLAELAEAMRAEGMLLPSDWNGDLVQTVHDGLYRWYASEMGAGNCEFLDLDLLYTDDMERAESQEEETGYYLSVHSGTWLREFGRRKNEKDYPPVGLFALASGDNDYDCSWGKQAFIGHSLEALHAATPGAGYAILGLLQDVLRLFGCATPEWGVRLLEYTGGFRAREDEDEEEPEGGYYFGHANYSPRQVEKHLERSLKRFRRQFPRGVWTAKWRPAVVRRALRQAAPGMELDRAICHAALELGAVWDAVPSDYLLNQWFLFNLHGEETVCPVIVRWDGNDALNRLHDDFMELAMENAGFSTVIYGRGWQMDYPESTRECLRGLRTSVDLVVKADRLLQLLHTPRERERVRVR